MKGKTLRGAGTLVGFLFLGELILVAKKGWMPLVPWAGQDSPVPGTTAAVGKLLFTTYALPFEVASGLLLVGIIGAIVLAKTNLKGSDQRSDPFKR